MKNKIRKFFINWNYTFKTNYLGIVIGRYLYKKRHHIYNFEKKKKLSMVFF